MALKGILLKGIILVAFLIYLSKLVFFQAAATYSIDFLVFRQAAAVVLSFLHPHFFSLENPPPPPETLTYVNLAIQEDELVRMWTERAAYHVRGCLVCLAFSQDGETFAELPGTMIRSDGIIATSASCLSSLKSKGLKVTVDVRILDTGETCNGVLLDAASCSDIAFVKISSCGQQPVPSFGKSDSLRFMHFVMAAGCSSPYRGCVSAEPRYVKCSLGLIEGRRTSGLIIEADVTKSRAPGIGDCLVNPNAGVVGIIHHVHDYEIKATPIELVFKTLEHIKMHGMHGYITSFNMEIHRYAVLPLVQARNTGKDLVVYP